MERIKPTVECTIILPESLINEIREFQKYISDTFGKKWEFGETITLLLRYAIKDFDKISQVHLEILEPYFAQKLNLLDDIYLNAIRSSYSGRALCTV